MTDLANVHRLAPHIPAEGNPAGRACAPSGLTLGGSREGLVTPPVCLTGETRCDFDDTAPFFVDWLSISQEHTEGGLPVVSCGAVWSTDEDGEVRWKSIRRVQHEGSFETSIGIRCDGHRVEVTGNIGRFGRPENVFGFGLVECLRRANDLLSTYGLPPFTPGVRREVTTKNGDGSCTPRTIWTGARISRIDLTANFETGSQANASAFLAALSQQHKSKQRGATVAQGETVSWGGGRRQYWKAYNKARELEAHGCTDARIVEHCKAVGLVRFEGTVRSNALTDLGCAYLGDYLTGWAMSQLIRLYSEASQILGRCEKSTDDLDELPRALRATARDYMAGMDVRSVLSRATFYRHRTQLLRYGIDIAMTNIAPFKPRVQVIRLTPAVQPHWYQLAA
jgi:hypothetical protein